MPTDDRVITVSVTETGFAFSTNKSGPPELPAPVSSAVNAASGESFSPELPAPVSSKLSAPEPESGTPLMR